MLSEKLMGAEGTKIEEDFLEMERVQVFENLLDRGEHGVLTLSVCLSACLPECCSDPVSADRAAAQNYGLPPAEPRY